MQEMPQSLRNAYDNLKKLIVQLSEIIKETKRIDLDMLGQKESIAKVNDSIDVLERRLNQLLLTGQLPKGEGDTVSSVIRTIEKDIKGESIQEKQVTIQGKIDELKNRVNVIFHPLDETVTQLVKTQDEISAMRNQLSEKQNRITLLEEDTKALKEENAELSYKTVDQTNQINALNHKIRILTQDKLDLKENIERNKEAIKGLQAEMDKTLAVMQSTRKENEKVMHLYNDFLRYGKEEVDPTLRLPSNIIIQGVSEGLSSMAKLFENLKRICEFDTALARGLEGSKAFRNTLTSESYKDVLGSIFSGIQDVEDSTYSAAKNAIDEEEVWIGDPKNQRYMHTEIFLPFIRSARNLLKTRQETLVKGIEHLIRTLTKIRDNPSIKRILIRRTGIRVLSLEGCEIVSTDLPQNLNSMSLNIGAILGTLNTEIEEKKRDLNTQFFEIIRSTAKDAAESGDRITDLAAFAILKITLNILRRSSEPSSELKKLFSKTLVLI